LPNDTTMQSRSFGIIEDRISVKLQKLSADILKENLIEEVKLSMQAATMDYRNDFDLWKQSIEGTIVLSKSKYPKIACSFDMGWQKRSSGNRYDSPSGHALLIGARTRKPVAFMLKSKVCNYCKTWEKKQRASADPLPVPDHRCTKNHSSSSSAMEPQACLVMVVSTYNDFNVIVQYIVADDDSSTRAYVKWTNDDYMRNNDTLIAPTIAKVKGKNKGELKKRPNKGRLPGHIPEPIFVADPGHRKKIMTGEFEKLLKMSVEIKHTFTKIDATRIGKNFAYLIRQLPRLQEDQYEAAGKAVLDHHFDVHDNCGQWCRRKVLLQSGDADNKKRFYRSMEKDAKVYKVLHDIVSKYVAIDRLKEIAHGMDTNVNESLNNTFSWLAPKNKVYCGSQSLHNRLSIAIGINTLGIDQYFKRLFNRLGIIMTPNVRHYLSIKDTNRTKRINNTKVRQIKIKRKEKY
jgi:hypothetical protein